MRRLLMMVALVCVFSVPTFAGDIPISGSPAPPPPGTVQTDSTTPGDIPSVTGDIPTDGVAEQLANDWLTVITAILSF